MKVFCNLRSYDARKGTFRQWLKKRHPQPSRRPLPPDQARPLKLLPRRSHQRPAGQLDHRRPPHRQPALAGRSPGHALRPTSACTPPSSCCRQPRATQPCSASSTSTSKKTPPHILGIAEGTVKSRLNRAPRRALAAPQHTSAGAGITPPAQLIHSKNSHGITREDPWIPPPTQPPKRSSKLPPPRRSTRASRHGRGPCASPCFAVSGTRRSSLSSATSSRYSPSSASIPSILHDTAQQITGVQIAYMLPIAVHGVMAGVFVDRWPLKPTMVSSDSIRAILVLLLLFASRTWHYYAVLAAISIVSSFFGRRRE